MKIEEFLVITIDSTHLVMKVEKELLDRKIEVRVIPLPGELKASCGLSIKANINDINGILSVLNDLNISSDVYSIYTCKKIGFKKEFSAFNF